MHDAIIIGGGHNGLTAAAYLARAGRKVLVLERRPVLGGACVTEEIFPGCKVSTAAYVNSLLRPQIIRELDLPRYGFEMLPRSPSSFTPFPDGRSLLMGPDAKLTYEEVSKFSPRDAEALPKYEATLLRVAEFLEPLLDETPPDPFSNRLGDLWQLAKIGWRFRKLGKDAASAVEVLTGAARPILDRWFESEQLKVTLATDAIIGAFASPSMPGTAYVLFHHVMGECNGVRGVWGYVRGGMGGISNALAASAKAHGAEIRTNAAVAKLLIRDGQIGGVVLEDGTELPARAVASNADANVTFLKLADPKELPPDFVSAIKSIDYSSASLKINVLLSELPNFTARLGAGPHLRGTIHICPDFETLERAYDDAKYGEPSRTPVLECTVPTVVDDTLAPPGRHLLSMFVQYAPYKLRNGTWDERRDEFAERCFDVLDQYAPNFRRSVIDRQVLAPPDIERVYGLTGGNIFQGCMHLDRLFFLRPALGWANYRTPVRGLYLCGSAAHPGGGVIGAAGRNAAREILRDLRRPRW
ncbi:MAG TPA: NAD(P)/FAD-dependent oxidoreductase [Gemmataceae bacterium]|nr:NAD(P)/FAD-dependent oxidoreductase [Gemmataceae bacterium]